MNEHLLQGIRVLDAAAEPLAMTGRMLSELGAEVVRLEPSGGDPLRNATPRHRCTHESLRFLAWNVGKKCIEYDRTDSSITALFRGADVIIVTPGVPGALEFSRSLAPGATWLIATPFGLEGPRAQWRASNLGVLAASGNLYANGVAKHDPLYRTEPATYPHASSEAVFAILTALASDRPQTIDLSMQETVMIANYLTRPAIKTSNDHAMATSPTPTLTLGTTDIPKSQHLQQRISFTDVVDGGQLPTRFFIATGPHYKTAARAGAVRTPRLNADPTPAWPEKNAIVAASAHQQPHSSPWQGMKLVEFGSGTAESIVSRYFSESGATVIRVEPKHFSDCFRATARDNANGLKSSSRFDALSAGRQCVSLNLEHPEGKAIAMQLIEWADAIVETFPVGFMTSYGLDYETLLTTKPDLVMASIYVGCQSGTDKGHQNLRDAVAGLSGLKSSTGWLEHEAAGTGNQDIDTLTPRFAASALAAGLLYRRRTGRGVHLDISQTETGVYSLSPWLLEQTANGSNTNSAENCSVQAAPYGVFPCAEAGSWIAIACWSDIEWLHLATILGLDANKCPDLNSRLATHDAIAARISASTKRRPANALARQLQYAGIEAVPVANSEDLLHDPQLQLREHFVPLNRPATGPEIYERNGFRFIDAEAGFSRAAPIPGEHTAEILASALGIDQQKLQELRSSGAIE